MYRWLCVGKMMEKFHNDVYRNYRLGARRKAGRHNHQKSHLYAGSFFT
ncbi:hypothetical protein [Mucilaginibacter celer]|nr:hypothetical protein [Mucilaginibacter celer]